MRDYVITWNRKLIATIPSTIIRRSYFRTFVLFLFLFLSTDSFFHWRASPDGDLYRLLSELRGFLSIGATSVLMMPHRCDNDPWIHGLLADTQRTIQRCLQELSVYLFYQNDCERWIFLLVLSVISVLPKTFFFSEKISGFITCICFHLNTMFNLLIDNCKIDIVMKIYKNTTLF